MPLNERMEHPRIDDERVVDRYLAGRLLPEDETRFEEHLFVCGDCLEQVEAGEELRRGLRAVAAEDAAHAAAFQQRARAVVKRQATEGLATLGLVAWLRSRSPAARAGLGALALVFALLPAVVLWQQVELGRLRDAGPKIATGGLAAPAADFQVVSLGVVRDAGVDAVAIRPDPEKDAVLLSLELPPGTAPRYRVTLRDAAGEAIWTGDELEPNLYDTLFVALPSSYLAPGSYRIEVEALLASGTEPAGEMAFRVLPEE